MRFGELVKMKSGETVRVERSFFAGRVLCHELNVQERGYSNIANGTVFVLFDSELKRNAE